MDPTPDDLIAAALAEPADSHEQWVHVHSLQRRRDEATFHAACELLESSESARRALGAAILGQLGVDGDVPLESRPFRRMSGEALVAQLESEQDPEVLEAIAHALGHLREERAIPALHALRRHPAPNYAMQWLPACSDSMKTSPLEHLLTSRATLKPGCATGRHSVSPT